LNHNPSRRSSLFLLELMIAILFFCLCSAVCVRLFVQSHTVSAHTQELSMAMNQTKSFAEIFRSEDKYLEILKEQFPSGIISLETNSFTVYYDRDWAACVGADADDEAVYAVSMRVSEESGGMSLADFEAVSISDQERIYQFETEKYTGGGDSDE
jgi:hypothetical protein